MPVYSSLKGICDSTRQVLSVSYGFSPVQGRSTIHLTKFSLCPTGLVLSKKKRRISTSARTVLSVPFGFTLLWEESTIRSSKSSLHHTGLLLSEKKKSAIRHVQSSLYPKALFFSYENLWFDTSSSLCILRVYSFPRRMPDSTRQVLFASSVFTPLQEESKIRHVKSSLPFPCLLLSEKSVRFDT